jgi:NAD(P)-dependent dehydrogenase (short-subunit alcohol dehydrogenase family)
MLHVHEIDLENVAGPGRLVLALSGKPVDLLINNAGVLFNQDNFTIMNFEQIRQSFEVNTILPMRVCQALHPLLRKGSRVVQITSLMGSIADNESGGYYGYRMSKAALNMFNRSYSIDFPEFTSVVLHPGWVKTEMGGQSAPVTPSESVAGMMGIIEKLSTEQSGKFFDFEGNELPW